MAQNRPKKTCSKAKREREILHDLDVLDRRKKNLTLAQEKNSDQEIAARITRELAGIVAAKARLHEELKDLWTVKKRPAKR